MVLVSRFRQIIRLLAIALVGPLVAVIFEVLNTEVTRALQRFEMELIAFVAIRMLIGIVYIAVLFWLYSCSAKPTVGTIAAYGIGTAVLLFTVFLNPIMLGSLFGLLTLCAYLCLLAVCMVRVQKRSAEDPA